MTKKLIPLLTILLFSLLGMKALFHPGLFTAHDIWHQVVRFYYYSQAINDGQLPPYWISKLANGFGYPLFFFSYHLPWIAGIPLLRAGFDISSAIRVLFFLSFLGSGLTMYFFVNNILKDKMSALLSSILYLWLPYHFLIVFVSASLGIAFIFIFLPLIFLGLHLVSEESALGIPILGLSLSGVIASHIMHLIFLLPMILIFVLWEFKCTKRKVFFFKNMCFGIVLGALISAFYLVPAIFYNQFTRVHREGGLTSLYERNFINFKQLVYSKWGYSPIVNNAKNEEVSFQLGIAQWLSVMSLFLLIIFKKLSTFKTLSICLLLSFTISIMLMLDFSSMLWKFLVKIVVVDFPFRLLLPAVFIASFCAGIVLVNTKKKLKNYIFISAILIAIYTNRNHLNVNQYTNFPLSSYLDLETEVTTNTFNEYLPILANPKLLNKPWNEIIGENLTVSDVKHTTNQLSFNVMAAKTTTASLGQFYFPGQTLYLNNIINQFNIDREGRISLEIAEGIHNIRLQYEETHLLRVSKSLTLLGILIVVFLILGKLLRKKPTFN